MIIFHWFQHTIKIEGLTTFFVISDESSYLFALLLSHFSSTNATPSLVVSGRQTVFWLVGEISSDASELISSTLDGVNISMLDGETTSILESGELEELPREHITGVSQVSLFSPPRLPPLKINRAIVVHI